MRNVFEVPVFSRVVGLACAVIGLAFMAGAQEARAAQGVAASKVMVLDFELNDLTLYPNVEQEEARVASLAPLLRATLDRVDAIDIVAPPDAAARESARGTGYVFERPAVAARLGRAVGADWVVSGRLHKASHLFVYLKAQLVDASDEGIAADFVVELKGWGEKLTRRGVDSLSLQIEEALASLGAP